MKYHKCLLCGFKRKRLGIMIYHLVMGHKIPITGCLNAKQCVFDQIKQYLSLGSCMELNEDNKMILNN